MAIEKRSVHIENHELREIRTLRQLNDFLHAKITGAKIVVAGRHYSREQIVLVLPQQPHFFS